MRLQADGWDETRCREWALRQALPYDAKVAPKVTATARVNHGRWLADCPFGCGGSMDVSPGLTYWCGTCGNLPVGGQCVKVDWPKDLEQIEDVLILRPDKATRNWEPGKLIRRAPYANKVDKAWSESLLDLAYENVEHGIPVPPAMQAATERYIVADWEWRGLAEEMVGFVK
jgi:hypothetical protein